MSTTPGTAAASDSPQGCVRVPVIRQTGASDCGLAALEMVLRYHATGYERHELRRALGDTAGGTTLEALRNAAHAFGCDAEGFEVAADQLDALPAPAILHWRRGHFVVYEGLARDCVSIVDPVGGRVLMRREDLARLYSGYALVLEPPRRRPAAAGPEPARPESEWGAARWVLAPWFRQERSGLPRLCAWALATAVVASAAIGWLGKAFAGAAERGAVHAAPAIAGAMLSAAAAAGLSGRAARLEASLTGTLGAFLSRRFAQTAASTPHAYLTTRTGRFLENLAGDLDPAVNARIPSLRCIRLLALALVTGLALLAVSVATGIVVLASFAAMAAGAEWRTRRWRARAARWRGPVQGAREWGAPYSPARWNCAPRARSPPRSSGGGISRRGRRRRLGVPGPLRRSPIWGC